MELCNAGGHHPRASTGHLYRFPWCVLDLEELMDRLPLGDLVNDFAFLQSLTQFLQTATQQSHQQQQKHVIGLDPDTALILVKRLANFAKLARDTELILTANQADAALEILQSGSDDGSKLDLSRQAASTLLSKLDMTTKFLPQEIGLRWVMIVSPSYAGFLENPAATFGPKFQTQFSGCLFDLDEAVKCLGASRPTAAVFHLLRMMEAGLRAIHACLGVTTPLTGVNRSWGKILERIDTAIEGRGKGWNERDSFRGQYAMLVAVKQAWRDPTMHLENRYSEEQARDIFHAVRGFMQILADRMDENGKPEAATS